MATITAIDPPSAQHAPEPTLTSASSQPATRPHRGRNLRSKGRHRGNPPAPEGTPPSGNLSSLSGNLVSTSGNTSNDPIPLGGILRGNHISTSGNTSSVTTPLGCTYLLDQTTPSENT